MSNNGAHALDIRFLPTALFTWFVSSLLLLPLVTLLVHFLKFSETTIAYTSSCMSFITALAAGNRAMRIRKKSALFTALISGMCIIIAALSLGYIIAGDALSPDGILSLVTFTLAGCLVGAVLLSGENKRKVKTRSPRPKRR